MPKRSSRRLHGSICGRSAAAALLVVAAAAAAASTIAVTATTATATSSSPSGGSGGRPRAAWIAPRPALPRSARPCPCPSSAVAWRSGGALNRIEPSGRKSTALAAGQHRGSSGTQRGKRRRDGGGGKSYKEREREKASKYNSLPLPMPPGDEDEAGAEGNKPEHWPEKVLYGQKLKWPSSASGGGVKEAFRRRLLPGIRVRYIDDPAHLLRGQYGVYATREFHPFDIVGEYVGRVVPPEKGGEYVATIDWEDRRFEDGAGEMWGVDSAEYGNEVRMINHFRGISGNGVPNCKLVTAYVNELPHIMAVVIRPIREGEELLLDYGPNYFSLGAFNPAPPEPPGIDDPPEVILEEGQAEGGAEDEDEESDV